MQIEFKHTAPGLLATVTKISRDEAKAMARYMDDRNLIAHATFDGIAKLEFFVPQVWGWAAEREAHATRYVNRVLTEIRMADTPF